MAFTMVRNPTSEKSQFHAPLHGPGISLFEYFKLLVSLDHADVLNMPRRHHHDPVESPVITGVLFFHEAHPCARGDDLLHDLPFVHLGTQNHLLPVMACGGRSI